MATLLNTNDCSICFEKLNGIKVLPLWYFNKDTENVTRTIHITNVLNQKYHIQKKMKAISIFYLGLLFLTLIQFSCKCLYIF